MGILRDMAEHLFPALTLSTAIAPKGGDEIRRLVEQFREERANDIAALADRAGRSGARLAIMERERDAWRAYAQALEKACLGAGLEMPLSPDEERPTQREP